jgi:hypothetical protein
MANEDQILIRASEGGRMRFWRGDHSGRHPLDLADWLLEQITEDERVLRAADSACIHYEACDDGLSEYLDLFTFDRLLADCEAKRRIVERHAPRVAGQGPHEGGLICGCSDGTDEYLATPWPCPDVRDIISVYTERQGYPEELRP